MEMIVKELVEKLRQLEDKVNGLEEAFKLLLNKDKRDVWSKPKGLGIMETQRPPKPSFEDLKEQIKGYIQTQCELSGFTEWPTLTRLTALFNRKTLHIQGGVSALLKALEKDELIRIESALKGPRRVLYVPLLDEYHFTTILRNNPELSKMYQENELKLPEQELKAKVREAYGKILRATFNTKDNSGLPTHKPKYFNF